MATTRAKLNSMYRIQTEWHFLVLCAEENWGSTLSESNETSAAQWNTYRGAATPANDYWTADNLQYLGTGPNACEAVPSGGTSCGLNRPMRVCTPGGADAYSNTCTWTGCGLGTMANQFFGGCVTNPTAGTLCCAN